MASSLSSPLIRSRNNMESSALSGGGVSGFGAPYADVESGGPASVSIGGVADAAQLLQQQQQQQQSHAHHHHSHDCAHHGHSHDGSMGEGGLGLPGSGGSSHRYATKASVPLSSYARHAGGAAAGAFVLFLILPGAYSAPTVVLFLCALGAIFCHFLYSWLLSKDDGTQAMRDVADPIREGARAFLATQYEAIGRLALVVAAVIFGSFQLRPAGMSGGVNNLSPFTLGALGAVSFGLGAACSAGAGYVSMVIAAQTNIRVTAAAARGYGEALATCFRGGAFSAILVLTMCVMGVTTLQMLLYTIFATNDGSAAGLRGDEEGGGGGGIGPGDVPLLTVGYGFGASFVALFMQLGGGIYTKAADVGADMVGKIEAGIPEDDPRNPAVIADLVGDMVGDCVGSSADIFESIAAEVIGAMILAGTLAREARLSSPSAFVYFPVMVHAVDIVVSSAGVLALGDGTEGTASGGSGSGAAALASLDPLSLMKRGYLFSLSCAAACFVVLTRVMLYDESAPSAWLHFLGCGFCGMATSYIFVLSTQHFTDYQFEPVRSIAEASVTGHGTNIIQGVAVGMSSTAIPVVAVSAAVLTSYWLGRTSGLGEGPNAGLFGTAVATMGMLSSAGYVLAMNNYGPIADNAGGISEMSSQPEHIRDATDRLDAAGNVTKAITKGYSIGSAAMACFLLFGALMDEMSAFAGVPFHSVNIATPEVLIGGLLGVMMVFYFVGLTVSAVGRTAKAVVEEVRKQFRESPGIMEFKAKPNYHACVRIVTAAALKEMRFPGMLTIAMPITVGMLFRFIGDFTDRPLLGAEVLCSFLMFATVAGILMALFLDNVGGAWDNAKKYIEMGHHGGKGSDAHKAAITGDTVGDPFKDTAGPSLHVVIKLLSTTILVLGPLFVSRVAPGNGSN